MAVDIQVVPSELVYSLAVVLLLPLLALLEL